jgi:hypothetical protein
LAGSFDPDDRHFPESLGRADPEQGRASTVDGRELSRFGATPILVAGLPSNAKRGEGTVHGIAVDQVRFKEVKNR